MMKTLVLNPSSNLVFSYLLGMSYHVFGGYRMVVFLETRHSVFTDVTSVVTSTNVTPMVTERRVTHKATIPSLQKSTIVISVGIERRV